MPLFIKFSVLRKLMAGETPLVHIHGTWNSGAIMYHAIGGEFSGECGQGYLGSRMRRFRQLNESGYRFLVGNGEDHWPIAPRIDEQTVVTLGVTTGLDLVGLESERERAVLVQRLKGSPVNSDTSS